MMNTALHQLTAPSIYPISMHLKLYIGNYKRDKKNQNCCVQMWILWPAKHLKSAFAFRVGGHTYSYVSSEYLGFIVERYI